ncbi:MAG: alpha-galactosidase [Pirellulales bacterium]|nr:alpha-galactosidase [Pirellulales bacterium]
MIRFRAGACVRWTVLVATICLLFLASAQAWAVEVLPDEMAEAGRWADARFQAKAEPVDAQPGIFVRANHDPVHRNARGGQPLALGEARFTRGLYCHAPSDVVVRLPGPGKTFEATVGVDSNDQTRPGRGSVVFSVEVAGKEAYRSELIREGMPGTPIAVPLGGASELVLKVSDGGDGISCDQADWADARATLEDGTVVWLGDLPMVAGESGLFATDPPFSFTYGGKPSAELLAQWPCRREIRSLDNNRRGHTLVWTDPESKLEVRCEAIEYLDFPTVEWTLYFKNAGHADSPILENIQALDIAWNRGPIGEFVLHHAVGSLASPSDYGPLVTPLGPGATKRLAAAGGRPSNTEMPYFNLDWGSRGMIVVVGWPGQWAANMTRDAGTSIHLVAGQELTHFKLLPGEEVRSPLVLLQFWHGNRVRSQNVWRRWMRAHGMPKPGGELPPPMVVAGSSRAYEEMIGATEANQIMHIDRYREEKIPIAYWWMDAGWYVQEHGWPQVGTWEVDPKRFPKGLRPISDHAHAKGMKILVWFEPERVAADTWLAKNHPEWILGGAQGGLLNLGNPEAWKWLVEHVDLLITEQGIDLYRQDFNMDPLDFWRRNDAPDRQGITEIRHVTGYLAYWDALRKRHPNMLIDSCASGGRRNDLETMRRAVPLWRTDHPYVPISQQCMTHGISFWLPYHGTGTVACANVGYYGGGVTPVEPYVFWSNVAPSTGLGIDIRERGLDYDALRRLIGQWQEINPCYAGDFYPLMPYTQTGDVWAAWQFDLPEEGRGMIQAFRRADSPYQSARFPLQGLVPDAKYEVANVDGSQAREATGAELMTQGVLIQIDDKPGAAVMTYRRKP